MHYILFACCMILQDMYIDGDTSAGMKLFKILGSCSTAKQSMEQREAKSHLHLYVFLHFTTAIY